MLLFSYLNGATMKRYRIFNSAAKFIAALGVTVGLTIGLSGAVHAQDGASGQDASAPPGKSAAGAKKHLPCGGPSVIQCPQGLSCVDDPGDKCDPTKDGLECPGKCVAGSGGESKFKQPCGGPSRINCIGGMVCVDDPADNCDPTRDGLDCKGMCVTKP
jgi:hypothetical protein